MIIFDLDGTLLTSDGIVPLITINIIKTCKLKGYYISFITARSRSKKNIFLLGKIPYDFIAFYNGAEIYAENQLIESNVLPHKQAILMLRKLYADFPDLEIDIHQEPWKFSSIYKEICHMETGERKTCSLNKLPECDIQRIRLKSKFLTSIPLENYMISESTFYHTTFGDAIIVHKNANKGHAAQIAADFFNIPLSRIIAFGDDINPESVKLNYYEP